MAANRRNKCGWQNTCEKVRLCTHCVTGKCKFCRHDNCNEICDQFTLEPQCERLKRFPYVCSNCSDIDNCKSPKYFYNARKAQDQRNYNVRDWKSGPKIPAEEMTKIVPIFEEGIKNQKISPDMLIHNKNLNISTSTAYRYIHNRYMGTVMPIDLKRAVGYKTYKSSRPVTMPIDYNFLEGRRYSDFCETLPDLAPGTNIWEWTLF